jgi:hypothetical protein
MDAGHGVADAFVLANIAYPTCAGSNNCMRCGGDPELVLKTPRARRAFCGAVSGTDFNAVADLENTRAHHIACDAYVPSGQSLTIDTSPNEPFVEVAFVGDSRLTAHGWLTADIDHGEVLMVSAQDRSKGIQLTGELSMWNGGTIRIYE